MREKRGGGGGVGVQKARVLFFLLPFLHTDSAEIYFGRPQTTGSAKVDVGVSFVLFLCHQWMYMYMYAITK